MDLSRATAPVYVFVLWSHARAQEARILADLRASFEVVDLAEVTWTPGATFAWSLTRMYGDALPPDSEKERHCGNGPFLLVVVRDRRPALRPRRTSRGRRLLNSRVLDARLRYRDWTGGGYKVHASDCVAETERNLVLLLGRGIAELPVAPGLVPRQEVPSGSTAAVAPLLVPREVGDPVGTTGWLSVGQLSRVLTPYGARWVEDLGGRLRVTTTDGWWTEHLLGGQGLSPGLREVRVAGTPVLVEVHERPPLRSRVRPWSRTVDPTPPGAILTP